MRQRDERIGVEAEVWLGFRKREEIPRRDAFLHFFPLPVTSRTFGGEVCSRLDDSFGGGFRA